MELQDEIKLLHESNRARDRRPARVRDMNRLGCIDLNTVAATRLDFIASELRHRADPRADRPTGLDYPDLTPEEMERCRDQVDALVAWAQDEA